MKSKTLFICVLAAALFIWSCNEKSPVAPDFANQNETLDKKVSVPVGTVTPILLLIKGDPPAFFGDSPEGITIDKRGNMYISNTIGAARLTNQILRVENGSYSIFATLPAGAGHARGLVTDSRGNVYVAFKSDDESTHGVYRIGRNGTIIRLPGSKDIASPNALTFDAKGNLYVTSSYGEDPNNEDPNIKGAIWRFGKNNMFEMWFMDSQLDGGPHPGVGTLPGANGIVFYPPNKLYVANTFQSSISRIMIRPSGVATGIQQIAQHPWQLMNIDGIAVDVHENIYGVLVPSTLEELLPESVPPPPPLVMVNPNSGELTSIVGPEGASDFNTPTSLAFGTGGPWNRKSVFVANAGLFYEQSHEPWAAPGVVEVYVGKPGMPGK